MPRVPGKGGLHVKAQMPSQVLLNLEVGREDHIVKDIGLQSYGRTQTVATLREVLSMNKRMDGHGQSQQKNLENPSSLHTTFTRYP